MIRERKGIDRLWKTTELAYLRAHYAEDGCEAVANHLGRSMSAVYNHARQEGLQKKTKTKRKARLESSEFIDAQIKRAFEGTPTKGFVADLSLRVGRPRWWVSKRATELGYKQPRFKEPEWTELEYQLIEQHAAKTLQAIRQILARHGFQRTESAISIKLIRRGADRTDFDNMTATELAGLLGVYQGTVVRWIETGRLKAKARGSKRGKAQGGDIWRIHRRDVRAFIGENAALIDLRKVADKFWFIDILFEIPRSSAKKDAA